MLTLSLMLSHYNRTPLKQDYAGFYAAMNMKYFDSLTDWLRVLVPFNYPRIVLSVFLSSPRAIPPIMKLRRVGNIYQCLSISYVCGCNFGITIIINLLYIYSGQMVRYWCAQCCRCDDDDDVDPHSHAAAAGLHVSHTVCGFFICKRRGGEHHWGDGERY